MRSTPPPTAWLAAAILCAVAGIAGPAASEKFIIHDDQSIDDARTPAAGKALIYFMRTQKMGFAVKVKLFVDGEFAGLIQSKTFIPIEVDPGKHEFIAAAENAGFLEAEVAEGKIYYVQVAIHMGAMKARTHFEVVRPDSEAYDECTKAKADLRAVTTTEEGHAWVKEDWDKIQATIKKYREKGEEFEHLKPEDGFEKPLPAR